MIRINLLPKDAEGPVRAARIATPSYRRVGVLAAGLVMITAIGLMGWFWTLRKHSAALDAEIARATEQASGLQSVLAQVQTFEARKVQLEQRVTLIERLRTGQSTSVRVLDQISRSLPDQLWLGDINQSGSDFAIGGFAESMTALSDFVAGLESTGSFRKPVEIVDSQVTTDAQAGRLVRFAIKATYVDRSAPAPPATAPPVTPVDR